MVLVCMADIILLNRKTPGDAITAPGTATSALDLQKERLYRRKWQAGVDSVHGEKVWSFSHDRVW